MSNTSGLTTSGRAFGYVNGLQLAYDTTTLLSVNAGDCNDSTLSFQMYTDGLTINNATTGLNGVDTGTIAATTWYYVYIVGDSRGVNGTGGVMSLSSVSPAMPAGFNTFRRLGAIYSNASSQFDIFTVVGNSTTRQIYYDATKSLLSGGSSTSFTAIDCSTIAPPIANTLLILTLEFTPNAGGDTGAYRATGSSSTNGIPFAGTTAAKAQVYTPTNILSGVSSSGKSEIDYKVTASGALTVLGVGYHFYV